jgi:hypothetical protein
MKIKKIFKNNSYNKINDEREKKFGEDFSKLLNLTNLNLKFE